MKKISISASLLAAMVMGAAAVQAQEMPDQQIIINATQLTPEEMKELRGGFVDTTGLIYSFSVNVQTALNGTEVYQRNITVAPGSSGQFQGSMSSNLLRHNVDGMRVSVIGGGEGIQAIDRHGALTTVMNETSSGIPSSIVINSANDRNISQSVEMTLKLNSIAKDFMHARSDAMMAQRATMHQLGF